VNITLRSKRCAIEEDRHGKIRCSEGSRKVMKRLRILRRWFARAVRVCQAGMPGAPDRASLPFRIGRSGSGRKSFGVRNLR